MEDSLVEDDASCDVDFSLRTMLDPNLVRRPGGLDLKHFKFLTNKLEGVQIQDNWEYSL